MVAAAAGLGEPRTTLGGVNLVTGMRPELWAAVAPAPAPGTPPVSTNPSSAATATPCPPPNTTS